MSGCRGKVEGALAALDTAGSPLPLLPQTSYAVSFLMVVVYAFESHRTVLGGRARPPAALQVRAPPGHSGESPWPHTAPGSSRAIQDSPFSREFGVPLVPPAAAAPPAPAHGASPAGAEPLAGARLAGNSLHPGLVGARRRPSPLGAPRPCQDVPGLSHPSLPKAGAGADAPGAAARPRHLRHRHRARGALGRPRLQRHLQPLLLQVRPLRPRPCPGHRCGPRDTAGGLGPAAPLCPSSCLLLIYPNQDICSQVGAAPPCGAGGLREPRGAPGVAGPGPAHFPLFPSPAGARTRGWRRKSSSCCTCCWCSAAAR